MADIVRFGADASEYFNVVDRMRGSLRGLGGDLKNTGSFAGSFGGDGGAGGLMGFLKGERAVKGQAKFLVTSLLEARDASSAAESALQAFIYSSKVGLGAAVIGAGVFTAIKILHDEILEAAKAQEEFRAAVERPLKFADVLGPETLAKAFDAGSVALEKIQSHTQGVKSSILDFLKFGPIGGPEGGLINRFAEQTQADAAQQRELNTLAKDRGNAELRVAEAKARAKQEGSEEAELALLALTYAQKKAELAIKPDIGTPERRKALDVEQASAADEIKKKHAKEALDRETQNLDEYYKDLNEYLDETDARNAKAAEHKKEEDKKAIEETKKLKEQQFKDEQDLHAATGETGVAKLRSVGDKFGADILAKRVKTEGQIAQDIHNQNMGLARQHELASEIDIISAAAEEKNRRAKLSPADRAKEDQERAEQEARFKEEQARIEAILAMQKGRVPNQFMADQLGGITPEEAAAANAIKAQRDALAKGEKAPGEMDFTNLQNLSQMDFSNLQPLAGLQIVVQ